MTSTLLLRERAWARSSATIGSPAIAASTASRLTTRHWHGVTATLVTKYGSPSKQADSPKLAPTST